MTGPVKFLELVLALLLVCGAPPAKPTNLDTVQGKEIPALVVK